MLQLKEKHQLLKNIRNGIEILNWPVQSPSLNPIESIWALMKERIWLKQGTINSIDNLRDLVMNIFYDDKSIKTAIRNAYKGLIERFYACIDNNDGNIFY